MKIEHKVQTKKTQKLKNLQKLLKTLSLLTQMHYNVANVRVTV